MPATHKIKETKNANTLGVSLRPSHAKNGKLSHPRIAEADRTTRHYFIRGRVTGARSFSGPGVSRSVQLCTRPFWSTGFAIQHHRRIHPFTRDDRTAYVSLRSEERRVG